MIGRRRTFHGIAKGRGRYCGLIILALGYRLSVRPLLFFIPVLVPTFFVLFIYTFLALKKVRINISAYPQLLAFPNS